MDTLWSDVSEFQVPVDDSYPYQVLSIRSNDGTYQDHKFAQNYGWSRRALASGRLHALIIYMVYRQNWLDTLNMTKAMVGDPHPRTVFMLDVESWGGQITGDQSDGINRLYWGLADWLGTPARVIGYGNVGDLNRLWPTKPPGVRLIVAAYGSNPDYPGKIAHQFTDGLIDPLEVPPFGHADVNSADGLGVEEFCAAVGLNGARIERYKSTHEMRWQFGKQSTMTTDPTTSSVTQSADQTFAGSVFIHGPGPWIDVRAFGATGAGHTDDTLAIQAAINAVPGNGGTVFLPPGIYLVSAPLQLRKGLRLIGAGQQASVLRSNHTGDGLRMNSPLNASTPVNVLISDLGLTNTRGAANTGGALVDIGGTFWRIERVSVTGFAYGVILDQTELADVVASQFDQQTRACVWLVNGEDHLGAGSGVKAGFTNRISVQNCQLDPNSTGIGIVDDGGYTHYFQGNNFNGGIHNIRLAGLVGCWISNNELESASSDGIYATLRSSVLGGQGPCVNVTFQANVITVRGQGRHCILLESASPVLSMGNLYSSSGAVMAGVASCFSLTSISDYVSNPVPLTDGRAVNQLVLGSPNHRTPTVTGSTAGNTALTSLLTALSDTGLINNQTSTPTP